jgi:hypothetical protein
MHIRATNKGDDRSQHSAQWIDAAATPADAENPNNIHVTVNFQRQ